MALGRRAKQSLVVHGDPQRAQRVEAQRRRAFMVAKKRKERDATPDSDEQDNRDELEEQRRRLIESLQDVHRRELDRYIDRHVGRPHIDIDHRAAMGLIPREVLEFANDPRNVGVMPVFSDARYSDLMVVEFNHSDRESWDEYDWEILDRVDRRYLHDASRRGWLKPSTMMLQRFVLERTFPHRRSRHPSLVVSQYQDRHFTTNTQYGFLLQLAQLRHCGFDDQFFVRSQTLRRAIGEHYPLHPLDLSRLTPRERARRGLPSDYESDFDYVVSLEVLDEILDLRNGG